MSVIIKGGGNNVLADVDAMGNILVSGEGQKATYRAVTDLSFAANNQVMWQLGGSGTKKVKVNRIFMSGELTTAGSIRYSLQKLSSLCTGGTSASATPVPLDSGDAAATASLKTFTVAPTLGTSVGFVAEGLLLLNAPATVMATDRLVFDFCNPAIGVKPLTLNSAAEALVLVQNPGGTATAGLFLTVTVEFSEE